MKVRFHAVENDPVEHSRLTRMETLFHECVADDKGPSLSYIEVDGVKVRFVSITRGQHDVEIELAPVP